jgi:hypothetical protein
MLFRNLEVRFFTSPGSYVYQALGKPSSRSMNFV